MVTRSEDFTPMNCLVNYSDQNRIDNSGKIATCKKLSKLFMHLLRLDSPPSQTTVHAPAIISWNFNSTLGKLDQTKGNEEKKLNFVVKHGCCLLSSLSVAASVTALYVLTQYRNSR